MDGEDSDTPVLSRSPRLSCSAGHTPVLQGYFPKHNEGSPARMATPTTQGVSGSTTEFPLTYFYELESRVHTDQWSIPYKREESLAICMVATTNMIREGGELVWLREGLVDQCMVLTGPGVVYADENCRKFLDKTIVDSFTKVQSYIHLHTYLPLPPLSVVILSPLLLLCTLSVADS